LTSETVASSCLSFRVVQLVHYRHCQTATLAVTRFDSTGNVLYFFLDFLLNFNKRND
jgi:hypothetical protein